MSPRVFANSDGFANNSITISARSGNGTCFANYVQNRPAPWLRLCLCMVDTTTDQTPTIACVPFENHALQALRDGAPRRNATGFMQEHGRGRGTGNAYADEWLPCVISGKFNENQMR